MAAQGVTFLEKWVDENVTYLEKGGNALRAMTLADQCRDAAFALGLTFEEAEAQEGVLEKLIYEAMNYALGTPDD